MTAPLAKAPRTGRIARSVIAGTTAARVGVARVRHRLSADRSPQATAAHEHQIGMLIFAALTQLRGTALKAAQVLSMEASLLPPGVRAQLARATHQALPLNRAVVSRAFRQAFGCEPQALFARFDPDAFAAASLGQVHRAQLADGTELAVKLQYPGMDQTIDSDLRLLRASLSAIGHERLGLPSHSVIDKLLDDIRQQLEQELDYRLEAEQQAWFAAHVRHPDVDMARVVPALSCKTVLTQHYLPGRHVDAWLPARPSQTWRDGAGQALFDWFMRCAFVHHRIQPDMHPGNVLFAEGGRVGVLDFGCTCELGPAFARGLARSWLLWLRHGAKGADGLLATYRQLGLTDASLSVEAFRRRPLPQIGAVLGWATQPFTNERFDFADKTPPPAADFGDRSQRSAASFLRQVPIEMISFDRAWLGLMHLLTRLQCRVDTRAALGLLQDAAW